MRFGQPIKLRLPVEMHLNFEREAERLGKTLAAYIRERLELGDKLQDALDGVRNDVAGELAGLQRAFIRLQDKLEDGASANGDVAANNSVLIELLLVLRANTAPDKMAMIHGELRRLGLDVWTYNSKTR